MQGPRRRHGAAAAMHHKGKATSRASWLKDALQLLISRAMWLVGLLFGLVDHIIAISQQHQHKREQHQQSTGHTAQQGDSRQGPSASTGNACADDGAAGGSSSSASAHGASTGASAGAGGSSSSNSSSAKGSGSSNSSGGSSSGWFDYLKGAASKLWGSRAGRGNHSSSSSSADADGQRQHQHQGEAEEGEEEEEAGGDSELMHGSARLKKAVPQGATGEVARVMSCRDHFQVLEVTREADTAEIRRSYRSKALTVHPDKCKIPGAEQAFQRLNAAHEVLSDDTTRANYRKRLEQEESGFGAGSRASDSAFDAMYGSFAKSGFATVDEMIDAMDELVRQQMDPPFPGAEYPTFRVTEYDAFEPEGRPSFRIHCSCGYDHVATLVPGRTWSNARQCSCNQCGIMGSRLPARDGDVWFEAAGSLSSLFGRRRSNKLAYRCVGKHVYEITAWCECQGMFEDAYGFPVPTNTHQVPFRMQAPSKHKKRQAAKADTGFKGHGTKGPAQKGAKKKKGR